MKTATSLLTVALLSIGLAGTASAAKKDLPNSLTVTATAYNSHGKQTDSTPNIAAWGDELKPGIKAIAVSRDLLTRHGLTRGSKVRIKTPDGRYLDGEFLVLDKMNARWRKKIDIYMGKDVHKAKRWGKRKVTIHW